MNFIKVEGGYVNIEAIGAFFIKESIDVKNNVKTKKFILRCDFRDGFVNVAEYATREAAVEAMEKLVADLKAE